MARKKKDMSVDEAMDVIKAIDTLYQLQLFTKKMSGDEPGEADVIMDKFHEAVLVVDKHVAMSSIDIINGGK